MSGFFQAFTSGGDLDLTGNITVSEDGYINGTLYSGDFNTDGYVAFVDPTTQELRYWFEYNDSLGQFELWSYDTGSRVSGLVFTVPDGTGDLHLQEDGYVTGNLQVSGQLFQGSITTSEPTGTTQNIDWNNGAYQILDLENVTGDTTLTFSNAEEGAILYLEVRQDSLTARDITWPPEVIWPGGIAPVISAGSNAIDLVTLVYNGTYYLGTYAQNFG